MKNTELPKVVQGIIKDAVTSGSKGDYRVYNLYKQRLNRVPLSSYEYQEAVKQLATALRV
jgi:hypothetical protein